MVSVAPGITGTRRDWATKVRNILSGLDTSREPKPGFARSSRLRAAATSTPGGGRRFGVVQAETAHPQLACRGSHRLQCPIVESHYENPRAFTATVKQTAWFWAAVCTVTHTQGQSWRLRHVPVGKRSPTLPLRRSSGLHREYGGRQRGACDISVPNWKSQEDCGNER